MNTTDTVKQIVVIHNASSQIIKTISITDIKTEAVSTYIKETTLTTG